MLCLKPLKICTNFIDNINKALTSIGGKPLSITQKLWSATRRSTSNRRVRNVFKNREPWRDKGYPEDALLSQKEYGLLLERLPVG